MSVRDELFNGGLRVQRREAPQPPRPPSEHPHLELVAIPPGVSVASIAPDLVAPQSPAAEREVASGDRTLPNPAAAAAEPATSPLPDVAPALQAIRDGAAGIVAVTYLDGDRWNHVVCTQDFNHAIAGTALGEWKKQLDRQREASLR